MCCLTMTATLAMAQQNRGIGIYPGRPSEYFGPKIVKDNELRNLALHRAVYQYSANASYDNNLTAQLLTDGIVSQGEPAWLEVRCNDKPLNTADREKTLNISEWSSTVTEGSHATISYTWHGMVVEPDEILIEGFVAYDESKSFNGYGITCQLTEPGGKSRSMKMQGHSLPGEPYKRKVSSDPNKQTGGADVSACALKQSFRMKGGVRLGSLLFTFDQQNALYWSVKEVTLMHKGKRIAVLPADHFRSVWMTRRQCAAWVDLGAMADIQEVRIHPALPQGSIDVSISSDGSTWTKLGRLDLRSKKSPTLAVGAKARYVQLDAEAEKDTPLFISELEVIGRGGVTAQPQPEQGWHDGKYYLNGGPWTLKPLGDDEAPGITATVPATILSSYHNAGALPDPNTGDNLNFISESFFHRDFLYTRTFHVPSEMKGKHVLLNFDGINWKAEVKLNGHAIGRIDGAFIRGQFDISEYLNKGENQLEVLIRQTAHPGSRKTKTRESTSFNGGVLGADNPTFHATIGWDWITTIPGRDIGIWNDVYLSATNALTISDPLVSTILKDGKATMTPRVFLRNHSRETVAGILAGHIGDIRFEKNVILAPESEEEISFSPSSFKQLANQEMKLWWPVGYGEPNLYEAGYTFYPSDGDKKSIVEYNYKAGIREVTYAEEMQKLQLYVNGKRLVPLGGNWGFPENHLNYRGREYDIAVRYHQQMNCNMIRNWVGQTGDEEFFEACDRYGVMVWQDFWLANPVDGPNPDNEPMFMANARDFVRRIRQHASIALYCGRNEGYPPETLNKQLDEMTEQLVPGSLYIPSSADDGVSGHGPYQARPYKEYFEKQTGKLHSERGMPNIPNAASLRRMLDGRHYWPQDDQWGRHDFTQQGAQGGASFNRMLEERFGPLRVPEQMDTLAAYSRLAQWINYDGYRAMYEASQTERQGLLIWMSHSCWPSMVWQTYDYYFDPTAAYFGVRKACEPLHVQYNALTGMVQLVNMSVPTCEVGITATVFDLQGRPLWQRTARVESLTDTTIDCFFAEPPAAYRGTYFLSLTLQTDALPQLPSKNVYVLSTEGSHQDLWNIAPATVSMELKAIHDIAPDRRRMECLISNVGEAPALMLHLELRAQGSEQILPVVYSENYFHLMPGEQITVTVEWDQADAHGKNAVLGLSGFTPVDAKLDL